MPAYDFGDAAFDFGDGDAETEQYWRKRLGNQGSFSNPAPRPLWQRFIEGIDEFIRHDSPAAGVARRVVPYVPTIERDYQVDEPLPQRRANVKKRITQQEREHREVRANYDPADSVADYAVDFGSAVVGSLISDPSTLIGGFGKNVGEKLINMAGMNALADLGIQGAEIQEGVRDEYDPYEGALNLGIPVALGGAGHAASRLNSARKIRAGGRMPGYSDLIDTIIKLEGGGTLDNPKTSPKGAMGVMQVMPDTARKPGFGIRPWNGKTQEDLARVGRQYAAALNHKYGGDRAKVLAAYNGGPGRVDSAIRKYGSEWLRAMPKETRDYVHKGTLGDVKESVDWAETDKSFKDPSEVFDLLWGEDQRLKDEEDARVAQELMLRAKDGPEDLGESTLVRDEQPDSMFGYPDEGQYVNKQLAPNEDSLDFDPKASSDPWVATDYPDGTPKLGSVYDFEVSTGKKISWKTQQIAHDFAKEIEVDPNLLMQQYIDASEGSLGYIKNQLKEDWEDYQDNKYKYDDEDLAIDDFEEPEFDNFNEPEKYDSSFNTPEPHYDYIGSPLPYDQYEINKGIPVDLTQKKAIEEIASEKGVHPWDVAEAYLNSDASVGLDVVEIKHKVGQLLKYYAKTGVEEGPVTSNVKPNKIFPEIKFERKKSSKPSSLLKRSADAFLRMLKDDSGLLAPDPESLHQAITAWDKGTHYLLKGPDGTPLRIYHGTRTNYEGMPSGEHNKMPPGYVLYSTDPNFASDYANFYSDHHGDQYARVFPAYVKKDKRIGDFRKSEDLRKAINWYKNKYKENLRWGVEKDLESGDWAVWERPDMLEDIGWRGVYMTEKNSLNIMLKDDLVASVLDPNTYQNKTAGHRIVKTLKALIKDESGAYRGPGFDARDPASHVDPDEQTVINALKKARSIAGETRKLHRQEKGKRGAQLGRIQQEGLGEVGLYAQMKQAKGEMPHADWESIRGEFTQDQIDRLLNKINDNKQLLPWEKFDASLAMGKLIGLEGANFSKAPSMSEIKLLSKVYSPQLVKALLKDRTIMQKLVQGTRKALSIPRAIMSSMDLSAPFRQGLNYIHKPEWRRAFFHMFKLIGSEENSKALLDSIHSDPNWHLMREAGLAITDPHSHFMDEHEEMFQGADWAEKIPLLGTIGIKASNRAYSGFLNKLRADVFNDYLRQYEKAGINLATDPDKLKQVGAFINAATGRGNLPKKLESAAPFLADVFFSPRLIASRLKFFANPLTYLNSDPILRKEAWKSLFAMGALSIGVGALAKYGLGMELELDPRSSDFMKPKVGNTRYDIMGGYQQYITLAARFITEQEKTSSGEIRDFDPDKPFANNRGKAVFKFARNKLSPVASFVVDWATGKDTVGNDFNLTDAALDRITPMAMGDAADAFEEWKNDSAAKGPAMASPAIFGVGVQTYDPEELKKERTAKDVTSDFDFGDEASFDFGDGGFES